MSGLDHHASDTTHPLLIIKALRNMLIFLITNIIKREKKILLVEKVNEHNGNSYTQILNDISFVHRKIKHKT